MPRTIVTAIVSGAQTGADRGALDAAIDLGLGWGGWAPRGWLAEDDEIPAIYREHMRESAWSDYRLRTRLNIQDSDGTLIVSFSSKLTGGSAYTAEQCKAQRKPSKHLVLPEAGRTRITDPVRAALLDWIGERKISILNVAGPRESKAPGIQQAVHDALVWIFEDEVDDAALIGSTMEPWPPMVGGVLAAELKRRAHERLEKIGPCPGCGRAHRAHYCECGHRPEVSE